MAEIAAQPFPFAFKPQTMALVVIDMQRDFAEPGGFGASLGNDVSRVTAIVPTVKRLIEGFRAADLPVIHTRGVPPARPSDLPPAKRNRGNPSIRIGDAGPMGRVLIAGEPGTAIARGACAAARRDRHREARQGCVLCDVLRGGPQASSAPSSWSCRRHHRGVRADDDEGSERPRL